MITFAIIDLCGVIFKPLDSQNSLIFKCFIFFSIVFCEQIHNQIKNSKNYFFKSGKLKQLSSKLEIWDAEFISDVPGPAQLNFDFINLINAGDWPVYLKLQTTSDADFFEYYHLS